MEEVSNWVSSVQVFPRGDTWESGTRIFQSELLFGWVANRETPVRDLSGSLKINITGSLELLNGTNGVVWSANRNRVSEDPVLQLLDSGNLVLRDKKHGTSDIYI